MKKLVENSVSSIFAVFLVLLIGVLITTLQLDAENNDVQTGKVMINGDVVDTTLAFTFPQLSRDGYLEINGLTDLTNVMVTQYTISNFPVIQAWVRVTDESGYAITGLTHSNFSVTENSLVPSFDVDSVGGGQNPIAVSLVIDRSGSMIGTPIENVKIAANEFVDNMSVLDRASIVSFATDVSLDQLMTSDKNLLHTAINGIVATGSTYLYEGVYEGIAQCAGETGIKAVIAFSDGVITGVINYSQQDVIDYANLIGCPIYTIGIGSVDPIPLQALASNTGGDYYYAPTTADIAQIYQDISQSIMQQYLVVFNSPNPLKDGTSRTVVITVEENMFIDSDQFTYTAPTDVNDAPVTILTTATQNLINSTQPANQPVTISLYIVDDISVSTARLFYRVTDTGIYNQVDLVNTSGDLYEYTISGSEVLDPGMQFYFTASDGDGHSVSLPALQPYDFPYSFAVQPNEAPQLTHTPVVQSTVGQPIDISATAIDITNNITEVKLFFRNHANVLYQELVMTNTGGTNYSATIPEAYVDTFGIDYFISAWDDYGVRTDYGSADVPLFIEGLEYPSMYIIVEDINGYAQLLRFGTSDDATDGYDPDYDQYAPPLPPAGAADARFSNNGEDYLKDFRATNTNITIWNLSYQVSFNGDPVTLTWDNATFPEGRFRLKDAITEDGDFVDVDMTTQNSYTLTNPAITELEIVYTVEACFEKSVHLGWNLVGLPSDVANKFYKSVFPPALNGTLYGFNGTYYPEDSLEIDTGYWLRFPQDDIITICGYRIDSLTLELMTGWNLIAGPSCDIALTEIEDPGGIIIPSTLFGFDGAYFLSDTIYQGCGYWIRTSVPGQITMRCDGGGLPKSTIAHITIEQVFTHWTGLTVSDAKGREQTLYFAAEKPGSGYRPSFQLPPVPPKGAFDARFSDGNWASESKEPLVQIMADQFPLTVRMDISRSSDLTDLKVTEMILGSEGAIHYLTAGGSIEIHNRMVEAIRIEQVKAVPVTFFVHQNYPNPFNPETEIQYSIPERTHVEISVYNTLGQKITTLVQAEQEAGLQSVRWDGTNREGALQSSGIYFYQVRTGSSAVIRKMVLMK